MPSKHLTVGSAPRHFGNLPGKRDQLAVWCDDGRSLTWGRLNARSNQVARLVRDRGIGRGRQVATLLKNSCQSLEIIYGLAKLGVGVIPTNYRYAAGELAHALDHTDAGMVFVHEEFLPRLLEAAKELPALDEAHIVVVGKGADSDYDRLLERFDDSDFPLEAEDEDLFWMALTGGTTGQSKACIVTQRTKMTYFRLMSLEFETGPGDRMLITGAMHHGLGFMNSLHQLYEGGTVFIMADFDPVGALELIQKHRITVAPMVPTIFHGILGVPGREAWDVGSVRSLICTGAPLAAEVKRSVLKFFHNATLREFYGATETGMFTVLKIRDDFTKANSIGLPAYGMSIRLLDEDGGEVPQGSVGEFFKHGPLLGGTYYKNPEATRQNMRGQWAGVGDLGYRDEDGYYYIVGRNKDMIISGGVNIYPAEIENAIMTHPDVEEVAVIGIPHEKWGEVAKAFVVSKTGQPIPGEVIVECCTKQLASFKKPHQVEMLAELPKSAAGKVLKKELRAREEELVKQTTLKVGGR